MGVQPWPVFHLLPALFTGIFWGAHFLRRGEAGPALLVSVLPLLLFTRRRFTRTIIQVHSVTAGIWWLFTLNILVRQRWAAGEPWMRLAIILGGIAGLAFWAACRLENKRVSEFLHREEKTAGVSAGAFLGTAILLTVIQLQAPLPLLLAGRFSPGAGWLEAGGLAWYAAWLAGRLSRPEEWPRMRRLVWTGFSLVFFIQAGLGLSGAGAFLMTGQLHLPVPVMVLAGPLFRGDGYFMPLLFLAAVLLAGPAWCSWLCYFGAWDGQAASRRTRPLPLPAGWKLWRPAILALTVIIALVLRRTGVPAGYAIWLAVLFGLAGAGIMVWQSRQRGVMVHCLTWCPLGWLAVLLGRLNPFRLQIAPGCHQCGRCRPACRYHALTPADLARHRAGFSCTLCGDCLAFCPDGYLRFRFFGLTGRSVRNCFLTLVVVLHTVFLAVARI